MAEPLRCVFMGTPEIAVPSLHALSARTEVSCVVTQPDRPAGRGRGLRPPPVKVAAQALGLPVWQPQTLRGAESDPRLQGADLFVVLAYGELLRQPVLDLPTACINLHASLLPRWRGASPLQAVLRAGDAETGVSVMRMVRALDAGPVYLQQRIPLDNSATLPWLHDRIADVSAEALVAFLERWPDIQAEPQDEAQVTTCGKLTPEHGRLDPTQPAVDLERQVRAYTPMPGCWINAAGARLKIKQVAVVPAPPGLSPGATASIDREPILICGEDALALRSVQPPGKPPMPGTAWLNGYPLPERLG